MHEPGYDADSYHVFVVRLWKERAASAGRPAVWRYSLEDPRTRERKGFGSLSALMAFLQEQVGQCNRPDVV